LIESSNAALARALLRSSELPVSVVSPQVSDEPAMDDSNARSFSYRVRGYANDSHGYGGADELHGGPLIGPYGHHAAGWGPLCGVSPLAARAHSSRWRRLPC